MVKAILSALVITVISSQSFATAMSPERSRCLSLETHHKAHSSWKVAFREFQTDHNLTEDQRYHVSMRTAPKVLERLQQIQKITRKENQNRELIGDMTRFLRAMENGGIYTKPFAVRLLSRGLPNFEDAIDSAIFQGEIENNCLDKGLGERTSTTPSRAVR